MPTHPDPPHGLRPQRSKYFSASLFDLAISSFSFSPLTTTLLSSEQPTLPPSLVSMTPRPALTSSITRSTGSQLLSRRGCIGPATSPDRLPHPAGLLPSFVPLVASFVSLVSVLLEFPLLVDRLSASVVESDSAAIPMDSVTSNVQPLSYPVSLPSPQVHVQAALPSLPGIDNWKQPLGSEAFWVSPIN